MSTNFYYNNYYNNSRLTLSQKGKYSSILEWPCSTPLELFVCSKCKFKTTLQDLQAIHERSACILNYGCSIEIPSRQIRMGGGHYIRCHLCPYYTARDWFLKLHYAIVHKENNITQNMKKRSKDRFNPFGDDPYRYACVECLYKCKSRCNLNKHVQIHHTDPADEVWYQCEECPYLSNNRHYMKKHVLIKHANPSEIEWYQCEQCPYKDKFRFKLKNHVLAEHSSAGAMWYECQECLYRSRNKYTFKRHVLRSHGNPSEIKLYECTMCSYKCRTKQTLTKHNERKHMYMF